MVTKLFSVGMLCILGVDSVIGISPEPKTVIGCLAIGIGAFVSGFVVPGYIYKAVVKERDEYKEICLRNMASTSSAVQVGAELLKAIQKTEGR